MSAVKVTYLYCDGENCPRDDSDSPSAPFNIDPTTYRNIVEQRSEAEKAGWFRRGKKDYCSVCAPRYVSHTDG